MPLPKGILEQAPVAPWPLLDVYQAHNPKLLSSGSTCDCPICVEMRQVWKVDEVLRATRAMLEGRTKTSSCPLAEPG